MGGDLQGQTGVVGLAHSEWQFVCGQQEALQARRGARAPLQLPSSCCSIRFQPRDRRAGAVRRRGARRGGELSHRAEPADLQTWLGCAERLAGGRSWGGWGSAVWAGGASPACCARASQALRGTQKLLPHSYVGAPLTGSQPQLLAAFPPHALNRTHQLGIWDPGSETTTLGGPEGVPVREGAGSPPAVLEPHWGAGRGELGRARLTL